MAFDDRLLHTLTVKRLSATGTLDDYGQPVSTETSFATVKGLIQPRTTAEVALLSQGGAVASTHIGYLRLLAGLTTAAGERFVRDVEVIGLVAAQVHLVFGVG